MKLAPSPLSLFALLSIVVASWVAVPAVAQPDITATKANDVGGSAVVGTPFTWTITVRNEGSSVANFGNGSLLLIDGLPNVNMTYGSPSISAQSGLGFSPGSASLPCTINAATHLQCEATSGTVSLAAGGFFTVSVAATPTAAGTFDNPRSGRFCGGDPNDSITESDEGNNACSDSVVATTGASGPDLTVAKNNDVFDSTTLADGSFTWSLAVANGGTGSATFASGQTLLVDDLPSSGLAYGSPVLSGQTGISGTGGIACNVVAAQLSCTASGGTVTLAAGTGGFTVSVSATPSAAATYANPRGGGTCAVDPNGDITEGDETNNACSDSVTVAASPDLVATKSNDVADSAIVGTPFTWSITVRNQGGATADFGNGSTVVFDGLPNANMTFGSPSVTASSGLSFSPGSASMPCSINAASNLLCTATSGTTQLAAGGFFTVSVSATPTAAGTFDNPRSGGFCSADPNSSVDETNESNNQCSNTVVATTGVTGPDLTVAKTNDVFGSTEVAAGGWTWSLLVANGGGADATFASGQSILLDNLPSSNISYGSPVVSGATGISGPGSLSCGIASSNLTCTASGGDVTVTQSGSFTVSFSATPSASGTFANPRGGGSCAVDPSGNITEDDESNNACSDSVSVAASPDLTATKSNDTAGTGSIGTPFTWSITVSNVGGGVANFGNGSTVVFDALPNADMTYGSPSITASSGLSFSPAGASMPCAINASPALTCTATSGTTTLAAGGFFTVSFTATPTDAGTFDNPRSGGSCAADPNGGVAETDESNNACSDTVTVPVPLPELTVTKDNDTGGSSEVASSWTWSLAVANSGSADATFASGQTILVDDLPTTNISYGLPGVGSMAGVSGSGTISCSIVANQLSCTASGGSVVLAGGTGAFTVSFTADPSAAGTFANPRGGGVCAVDPNAVVDEDSDANNGCTDSVDVVASPDITASKTNDTSSNGGVGVPFTWSITVDVSDAQASFPSGAVLLRDDLPSSGATYGSAGVTASSGLGGTGTIVCGVSSSDLSCSATGGNVTITSGGSFTVSLSVTPTVAGSLDNPRSSGVCLADPNDVELETDEANNSCSDAVTVAGPDLTATKTNDTAGSGAVGISFGWTVAVANGGAGVASFASGEVILRDELPIGPAYGTFSATNPIGIGGTGTLACSESGDVLSCVASGGTVTIDPGGGFDAVGSVTPATSGTLDNPRAAGTCAVDPDAVLDEDNETNNGCSNSLSVAGPDLTATKSNDAAGSGAVGISFDWTVSVANGGAGVASFASGEVILRDELPIGPAYGTFSATNPSGIGGTGALACAESGNVLTCTASGGMVTIGPGGGFDAVGSVTPAASGALDNPRAAGTCAADPDAVLDEDDETNNGCSDSLSVAGPDLTATKSNDTAGSGAVGITFDWTVAVANGGAGVASFASGEVILRDDLPIGPTYGTFSATNPSGIGGTGTLACSESGNVLTCMASGGTVTIDPGGGFDAVGTVTPAASGTLDNPRAAGTCAADPDAVLDEDDETNNGCSDSLSVAGPDLTATKSNDTAGSGAVGISFDWTVAVANGGAGVASFASGETILRDDLPIGPTYGTFSATNPSGIGGTGALACAESGNVLTCTASGGTVTIDPGGGFDAAGSVTPTASGTLDNPRAAGTCAADPDAVLDEDDEANNGCSDSLSVAGPDLTATKSNDAGASAAVGFSFDWTVSVANAGPGHAVFQDGETILLDDLPAGATYGAFATANETGLSGTGTVVCSESASTLTCIASGGEVTLAAAAGFDAVGTVTPTVAGALSNPASGGVCAVDPDDLEIESDETNNDCADSVMVDGPDLTVSKANDTTGAGAVGIDFVWTLTVENVGVGNATFAAGDSVLRDDLPVGAAYGTFAAGSLSGVSGAGTFDCSVASEILACVVVGGPLTIDPGGSFVVSGTVTPTTPTRLDNPRLGGTCAVDPDDLLLESDDTNNACSDTVVVAGPDLVAAKDNDIAGMGSLGVPFTWAITVTNTAAGNAAFADGVVILLDELPADATYGAFSVSGVVDVVGPVSCGVTADVLTCWADGGPVTITENGTFVVSGTVTPTASGLLSNPIDGGVCAVDPEAQVEEDNEANNECGDTVVVSAPDLVLIKDDGAAVVSVGDGLIYTLSYANAGSLDAVDVVLTETVPAQTRFDAASSDAGWTCLPDGSAGSTCELALGTVAPSAAGSVLFAVEVVDGAPGRPIVNVASLADDGSNGDDADPASNTDSTTTLFANEIPTQGFWGLLLLVCLLTAAGSLILRR